jgi:hypothetical protein
MRSFRVAGTLATIATASLVASCASSSGVFQIGPNTYQITTTAITSFGGMGSARASAIQTANDYCVRLDKHLLVLDATNDSQFTEGSSDVKFRCEL